MIANERIPSIYQIDTKPMGHEQIIASFLVKGCDKTALIDPGFPVSAKTVAEEIEKVNMDPHEINYIILTHTHIDHSGAAGWLARIAEDAKVVTHDRGAFYLRNSGKIGGGAKMVFGAELAEQFGEPVDIAEDRIWAVSDGDIIDLGDKSLMVYYTPGHSSDHISLFEPSTGTLFAGDTACLHYPQLNHVLIPAGSPPIYSAHYIIEELRKLSALKIEKILTPHFGETDLSPRYFFSKNSQAVKNTRDKIVKMFSEGLEFSQVVERLRADIIEKSGNQRSTVPTFLTDVWLRAMLKTGLMGYMADVLQYARDIRPFHQSVSELEEL